MSAETITPVVPQRETPAMHTFAEDQGRPPFDWNAFLAQEHTPEEWLEARPLSKDWVTCACGNQCAVIPRWQSNDLIAGHPIHPLNAGEPKDGQLSGLGLQFHNCIMRRDAIAARETLAAIEARSAELLREMAAQS